jgi:hypothetical protein
MEAMNDGYKWIYTVVLKDEVYRILLMMTIDQDIMHEAKEFWNRYAI